MLLGTVLLPLATQGTLTPAATTAAYVLGAGLLCSVGNFLVVEPQATSLMFQR